MPIYCYRCTRCSQKTEVFKGHYNPDPTIHCEYCGKTAERSFSDERVNTDCNDSERWSEAMGVAPNQVAEAQRTFPGSTYDKQGRLLIKNRAHKIKEMKARGYCEIE